MPNTKNYRQRLYAEKEELLRQIKALKMRFNQSQGDSMQELSTYDNHPADIGTETFERSKDLGLLDNNLLLLARTEKALKRIEDGSYGICEHCGQEIPPERLQLVPATSLCVSCQKELEKQQGPSPRRPIEEEVFSSSFGHTLGGEKENAFDGEDSWQAVARYNEQADVYYEDIGEDEDEIGLVEETDAISNRDYKRQL